jgi:amino acid permease
MLIYSCCHDHKEQEIEWRSNDKLYPRFDFTISSSADILALPSSALDLTASLNMSSFSERARATKLAESTVTHDEELKVTQGDDSLGNLGLGPSKLQQNFNVWSLGFMAFCTSVTWEAVSSAMAQGMSTGGTSSLVWGFVLCATGAMLVIACFADYVSMIPTAGGQHHYVFELAPPKFRRILSWYVGWLTMLGWVLCALAGNFATAMQFQSWAILFSQNYAYERWHTTMVR